MKSIVCLLLLGLASAHASVIEPYERTTYPNKRTQIDQLVQQKLNHYQITPAHACSDAVFVRRLFLDVNGTLPPMATVRKFLASKQANKRERLINQVLNHDNFNHYWSLKWGDLLRIKAEFPINLWPNGVQAYHRWVYKSLVDNLPYDQFARALLTASGSNFRVPEVNFYRAIEGQEPSTIAAAVALTFMGVRFQALSPQQQIDFTHIFSRVAYKSTTEWKEEIVYPSPLLQTTMQLTFLDGSKQTIAAGQDPRQAFSNWLLRADNPWFARAMANRVWFWLFGRGIIHQPDDIRADNPASNPELLHYLSEQLISHHYDVRHLFKLILNSRTYQQSAFRQSEHPQAQALFAYYSPRRLDAEVLVDAINNVAGVGDLYQSPVPEPFTFVPETHKTIQLADGSITSQFLNKFGRPARDTGQELERSNEPSVDQAMFLLNSSEVHHKLTHSPKLKQAYKKFAKQPEKLINRLYYLLLSRKATEQEQQTAIRYLNQQPNKKQATEDLAWALLNSKEFLFRH